MSNRRRFQQPDAPPQSLDNLHERAARLGHLGRTQSLPTRLRCPRGQYHHGENGDPLGLPAAGCGNGKKRHAGMLEALRLLQEHGANKHMKGNDGRTALHIAAHAGKLEALTLLLQQGADLHAKDNDIWTPLHSTAGGGKAEALALLLKHGADLHTREKTALHHYAL